MAVISTKIWIVRMFLKMEAPASQTVSRQVADGKTEKSTGRSLFTLMSAQEDTLTPRGNIEGLLATAREDNTTPDVSKRPASSSSASTVFKVPDQPDSFSAPRLLVPIPTPGSKFTPRTNIFNLLHYTEDVEQTPTVRGNDWSEQVSSETRVSPKHPEWNQEISLSPMFLSQTSEGQEDSPSIVKQAFKRARRSFHIPLTQSVMAASQTASKQRPEDVGLTPTVRGNDWSEQVTSETRVSPKHPEWNQEVSLSPMYLSQTSEGEDDSPSIVKQAFKRARRSFHIPLSQTVMAASQTASEQTPVPFEENPIDVALESGGLPVAETENLDFFVSTNLAEIQASMLENFDVELNTNMSRVQASTLENFDVELNTNMSRVQASTLENFDVELNTNMSRIQASTLENFDAELNTNMSKIQASTLENFDAELNTSMSKIQASTLENIDAELNTNMSRIQASTLENFDAELNTSMSKIQASTLENFDAEFNTNMSKIQASTLENFDVELNTNMSRVQASTLENFDVEVITDLEGRHLSAVEKVDPEALSGNLDFFLQKDLGIASSVVPENIDAFIDGEVVSKDVEGELLSADCPMGVNSEKSDAAGGDRSQTTVENDELGFEAAEEDAGVRHELTKEKSFGGSRALLTSKHGKISYILSPKRTPKDKQAASTPTSSVYDLSESSSSSGDVHITKQKSSSSRSGTYNMRSLGKRGTGSAKSSKQNVSSGRTSVSRNYADNVRSSGKRGTGSSKSSKQNISSGRTSVSRNKSKLSYSEWKSLQRGKDSTGQTVTSFLDCQYPLSSTPFNRKKKIFNSTRIQHSVLANEDATEAQMTDCIPNISPIRPVARNQAEKRTSSGHEIVDADTEQDNHDVQEVFMSSQHRESGSVDQEQESVRLGEDSSEAAFSGFSPLATPHLDMDKRTQDSAAGQKSTQEPTTRPQPSGSGQKLGKEKEQTGKPPRKRAKMSTDTALPRKSVKFFAERHSTMKLSKDAVEEIETASEIFWDQTFKALETFALHAGRKIVKEEDVVLLMKTQRLIKDTEDLHDGIREFLPMELRSELIPMAKP